MRLGRSGANAPEEAPSSPRERTASAPAARPSARPPGQPSGQSSRRHPFIGELLLSRQALTSGQLAEALLQQSASGKQLGALLIEVGLVDERDITAALAEQFHLPIVDLRTVTPDPDAAILLPESLARGLRAVPLGIEDDGSVRIAVGEPSEAVEAELRTALSRDIRLLLAAPTEIRRAIDNTYRALAGVEQQIAAFTATQAQRGVVRTTTAELASDEAPVVQVVNMLITQGLRDRASDVHIEPQDGRVRVRYRIDGALHDVVGLPGEMASALASRIKIMGGMNIVERRRPQDGQIAMDVDGRPIDIRVSTTGTIWGEKVVLRLLDKSRPAYRLQELGMPHATHERYAQLIRSPFGMVLCAGPTGSGKTTTLYASMTEINGPERNVTSIEDPVEYIFPSINQIQINETAGITFAGGLRAILRQDPDVILVGEIRDVETARIAVQSALTGHFVLSSLHATDAVSALYRFLDMGIESFLIASSVMGVVGQRLVRKTCEYCRVAYSPTAEELAFYRQAGGNEKLEFWAGEGCNFCSRTGYSDRIGVYELLQITGEMRELIVCPHPSQADMRQLAVEQGMSPLRAEAVRLVDEDVTTIAEVVRSIYIL